MAYFLNAQKAQLMTVYGSIGGQQIINRFFYSYQGTLPNPDADTSILFLTNFVAMYRATILPVAWDDYTVSRYTMAELLDVTVVAGPPVRYRTDFDPSKFQQTFGTVADKGGIASAGLVKIPTHECMRLLWNPVDRVPKRFRSNYSRLALGFPTASVGPTPEQWSPGVLAAVQAAYSAMALVSISGVAAPVGTGYYPSAWSPPYYIQVVKPAGDPLRDACKQFANTTAEKYVGTQVTRRFFPLGGFRGV